MTVFGSDFGTVPPAQPPAFAVSDQAVVVVPALEDPHAEAENFKASAFTISAQFFPHLPSFCFIK